MTDELRADEKHCPYCAEVIKAAAIRCRWCGSDLPEQEPEPAVDRGPGPGPAPASAPDRREGRGTAPEPATVGRLPWLLTGVLAFVLVLAGTVLVRQLMAQGDWPRVPEGNTPLSAGAVVQSGEAKQAAMMAATSATEQVLSYRAKTFDEDVKASMALLDGEMEQQYSSTMKAIRGKTADNTASVAASVVSVSTISATEHDAKLLMFVNQQTTGQHLDQPRVDLNRVVVTIHRDGGDWRITRLDAM